MTLIKKELWQSYFGHGDKDPPMPEDCTYWQFVAAREALWQSEDADWSVAYLKHLRHLKTLPHMEKYQDELDELIINELERIENL